MRSETLPDATLHRVSELIAETAGLHFPPERHSDLQRGLDSAAIELGFADTRSCIDWLLATVANEPRVHALVGHLAIGDTYFFRERRMFEALAQHVVPELIRRDTRRLRIWSAACSTGEEPYSLAIVLRELLPERHNWDLTLLATDINERSLQKATAGVYGEWSFRDAPPGFKERYFQRTPQGRFVIADDIRNMVHFTRFNLAENHWPPLVTGDNAMDLILCRNVLMYFSVARARRAVENLSSSLTDDGWLVVSPSEYSQTTFARLSSVNFPDCILYRKRSALSSQPATSTDEHIALEGQRWQAPPSGDPMSSDRAPEAAAALNPTLSYATRSTALASDAATSRATAVRTALPDAERPPPTASAQHDTATSAAATSSPEHHALLTRTLANQGKLEQALTAADRWIAADKTNPSAHYLQAMVNQELGHLEAARRALQRAIYLKPDFVVAHFALGNLARAAAGSDAATRHFTNALTLVRRFPPEEPLLESEGTTAAYLAQVISGLLAPTGGSLAGRSVAAPAQRPTMGARE